MPLHSRNYTGFPSAAATYTQQIVNKQLLLYGCYSELCQSISGLPVVNRAPNLLETLSLKWSPPYMATTPIVTHTYTPRTSMGQLVLWKHLDKHRVLQVATYSGQSSHKSTWYYGRCSTNTQSFEDWNNHTTYITRALKCKTLGGIRMQALDAGIYTNTLLRYPLHMRV